TGWTGVRCCVTARGVVWGALSRVGAADGRWRGAGRRPPPARHNPSKGRDDLMPGDRKDAHHPNHPRRDELTEQIRNGEIDTLIVALTDMQGRLMGKRVQGEAFLNGAIDHGAHFCTYLLGTDMEMNTPDGFALMNWETGYGDWIADPVWDTLRPVPWLEKSA